MKTHTKLCLRLRILTRRKWKKYVSKCWRCVKSRSRRISVQSRESTTSETKRSKVCLTKCKIDSSQRTLIRPLHKYPRGPLICTIWWVRQSKKGRRKCIICWRSTKIAIRNHLTTLENSKWSQGWSILRITKTGYTCSLKVAETFRFTNVVTPTFMEIHLNKKKAQNMWKLLTCSTSVIAGS